MKRLAIMASSSTRWLIAATLLIILSLTGFALDPSEHGFGIGSMVVFPIMFLVGILCVIPGIFSFDPGKDSLGTHLRNHSGQLVFGGTSFLLSLVIYSITIEPTASLWDCSEFIASAYKLQVPHTPGNPLLLIIGKIFSMLAFGDVTRVAWWLNIMSALFAAATVWLLFEIIYLITNKTSLLGAFAGSMCLAFSDTFWFSATEAETYAASSFFMLLMVRIALSYRQSNTDDSKLPLLGYLAGLSFCIHPMAILAIPVVSVIIILRKKKYSLKLWAQGLAIGVVIVLIINRFIAVGIFELAFNVDLFLVNSLSLPVFSGALVTLLILAVTSRFGLNRFSRFRPQILACILFIVGMLPYVVLFIRSAHNPPIDESNPENPQLIKAYMNREGYPSRPLLFGPYFDAQVVEVTEGQKVYYVDKDRYKVAGTIPRYGYTKGRQTIFPRIYSNDPDHIETYRAWTGLSDKEVPGFADNLSFLLKYQVGHMYLRYLMFNFAGRSSDEQGDDWLRPWESRSIDGPANFQSRARNQYWMLPLLVGLSGMIFQYRRDRRGFAAVLTLFAVTGILLAVYLNSTPNEPRERDYIYVGSFIAFSAWIGAGLSYLLTLGNRRHFKYVLQILAVSLPLWVCFENFDDHDRSGRTLQVDNARNVLASCEPNSILFTGGDNDTFPLWYLQEVEGFRTDVRVMVLSYMNTDWYINQLRKQYYESKPFKFTLNEDAYRQYGPNDVLYVKNQFPAGIDAARFLDLLNEGHAALRIQTGEDDAYGIAPSKKFILVQSPQSNEEVSLSITGNHLLKNGLAILDLMVNNPERPVHFNFGSATQTGLSVDQHLVQKGQIYQWKEKITNDGMAIDTEMTYRNLIEQMNYSNLLNPGIYLNVEDHQNRIINPLRMSFNNLAIALMKEGKNEKASEIMAHATKFLYADHLKPSFTNLQAAEILNELHDRKSAVALAGSLFEYCSSMKRISNDPFHDRLLRYAAEILHELGEPHDAEPI